MLLSCLRHEYREGQCHACDQQDAPERQMQAVRQPCPARRCAFRRPVAREQLLDLLQRPGMSAGKAGVEHGSKHRRHVAIGVFQNG
jgi:hypothetical protein